jgi:DNA end-binding protein Ku
MNLIEAKAKGERIPVAPEPEPRGEVVDLMDALKKSLGARSEEPKRKSADEPRARASDAKKKPAARKSSHRKAAPRKAASRKPAARKKAASR